jgi:excisionase family DNA binding protein
MAGRINGLAETADALGEFEGRPFKRKPIELGRRQRKAKARPRAGAPAAETGPEEAALATVERTAGALVDLFRDVVTRLAERISSARPRRAVGKIKSGVSLTPPLLAERLGVSPDKVRGWIKSGQLAATDVSKRPGGRPRYRISEDAVRKFEQKRKAGEPPAAPQKRRKKDPGVKKFF